MMQDKQLEEFEKEKRLLELSFESANKVIHKLDDRVSDLGSRIQKL